MAAKGPSHQDELFPLIYRELRRLAVGYLARATVLPRAELGRDPVRSLPDHVAVVPVADGGQAGRERTRDGLVEVRRAHAARPRRDRAVEAAKVKARRAQRFRASA